MKKPVLSHDFKDLKRKYITAFLSIFLFTVLAQVFIQYSISIQKENSNIINLAGRQRMLSQKILRLTFSINQQANKQLKTELKNTLNLFQESHLLLIKKNPFSKEVEKSYLKLSSLVKDLNNTAECFLNKCFSPQKKLIQLSALADNFLPKMNSIVFKSDSESSQQLLMLSRIEYIIFITITLLMLYEFFGVLYPYQKKIEHEKEVILQSSKLATLGEMSAGIAHEINNPLSMIIGTANSMKKKGGDPIIFADIVLASAKRIDRISNSLRKFSRKSSDINKDYHFIKDIINDSIELTAAKAKISDIQIKDLSQAESQIYCDEIQISQIITNLISNAIDAITNQEKPWIEISSVEMPSELLIIVKDSGTGIEQEVVQQLFNTFFTTKEVGKGTGLGLSLSRGIAKSHDGSLEYQLISGNTAFVLSLPIKAKEA